MCYITALFDYSNYITALFDYPNYITALFGYSKFIFNIQIAKVVVL